MKLTATQVKKLTPKLHHIVGSCDCLASSKTCTYWKKIDSKDRDWQVKAILNEIKKL